MHTQDAIKNRRSIKHYDPAHKMSCEEIEELISLAMLSPTAFNLQHWRFVQVEDNAQRQQMRDAAGGQTQMTDASLLLVLCADLKAWEKDPQRYWQNSPQEVQDYLMLLIGSYYKNRAQVERDEAMRSCGLAAQTIMIAAQSMGYQSCPMVGFDFDKVAEIISLPDDHIIAMCVAVGKGTKETWERPGQLPMEEVLIKNSFDKN